MHQSPRSAMALISIAELLAMSVWFSASAVVPALRTEWRLDASAVSWMTLAVQLGFVIGTLLSAVFNLPDIMNPRIFCAVATWGAAISTALFSFFASGAASAITLRLFTGLFLAGVYPPAMKVMATWFRQGRGTAIGVLIGALTLGKATPYLLNALGTENWRMILLLNAILAAAGGILILKFVGDGPYAVPVAKFDFHQVKKVFTNRGVRLASFGYFGHMWELYAMWTWAPVMIRASLATRGADPMFAEIASFFTIGFGAAGCIVAGILADRAGRTLVASLAMAISGTCCLIIGFLFGAPAWMLLVVMAIWGASVVADSAQFSTSVTELGDPEYVGTALTLQTCIGFLLTTFSIHLIPELLPSLGWKYAFAVLAPGPLLGVLSMLRLRKLPEALQLAQGRR